jgi:hypothetical protein
MTGLTPFLIQMMRTPSDALAKASPEKLARRYEIPPAFAAFYLGQWIGRA